MKPQPQSNHIVLCMHTGGASSWRERRIQDTIRWWTGSQFVHAEIYEPQSGLSFSARGLKRDGRTGIWWEDINYSHPERWVYVEMPYSWSDEHARKATWLDGRKYSYGAAIMKDVFKRGWFCFKTCRAILGHTAWAEYGTVTMQDAIRAGGCIVHDGGGRCGYGHGYGYGGDNFVV